METLTLKGIIEQEIHHLTPSKLFIANVLGFLSLETLKTAFVRKYGELKLVDVTYNTITNNGKAQFALLFGDATAVPFTYIAVGSSNTAPAASQTALGSELTTNGFARATGTFSRVTTTTTNDTAQLVKTFTASGSATIEEAGLFNAASGVTMFNRGLTGSKSLVSGDTYTVTYKVVLS